MKKIYSRPVTISIAVKMQQMICESIKGTSLTGLGMGGETTGDVSADSRSGSLWDDEE
jgi:hypothetical protein